MSVIVPQIPDVPPGLPMGLFTFLSRVKEAVDVIAGRRGTQLNKVVTYQDLIDMNLIDKNYDKVP